MSEVEKFIEINPAEAETIGYDGGVAELVNGEWVVVETTHWCKECPHA